MPHDPLVSLRGDRAKLPLVARAMGRYFLTGASLRGAGDNATFLHRATVDYRARPYVTLSGPIWHRLARRHAAFTVPFGLTVAYPWIGGWPVVCWLGLLILLGLGWIVRSVLRSVRYHRRNKRWVDPAAKALCAEVSFRYVKRRARNLIDLPRDWSPADGLAAVRVTVPGAKALTDRQEKALVRGVGGRLGIQDPKGNWSRAGSEVTVDISGTPLPPREVTLDSLREAIEAAPASRPVVGMSADGAVYADLENDSPHVAMSGAAGTGKTTLLRFLLAQRMAHGVGVIIVDAKRWSHRWLHNLPDDRVRYAYRIADIHATLVAVGEELQRRIECDEEELGTFREVDVVVEEINSVSKMLSAYWRGERKRIMNAAKELRDQDMDYDEADLDPPLLSPAVAALQYGVNMGRELQMHFWVAAQRLEANVFGSNTGGAVRQSFQLRFMAQWDRALWKMLASGQDYVAWPGGPRGLWGFAQDTEFKIVRAPDVSPADALALALSSTVHGPVLGQQDWTPGHGGQIEGETVPALVQAVKLSEAVDKLPGQLSLDSIRKASTRDMSFPESIGQDGPAKLYDLSSLVYWAESRKAS